MQKKNATNAKTDRLLEMQKKCKKNAFALPPPPPPPYGTRFTHLLHHGWTLEGCGLRLGTDVSVQDSDMGWDGLAGRWVCHVGGG